MTPNTRPQTPLEILIAAKALIDTPEKWYVGDFAAHRYTTDTPEPAYAYHYASIGGTKANCWCGMGAVARVASVDPGYIRSGLDFAQPANAAMGYLNDVVGKRHDNWFPDFNDHANTTHADVMAAFDSAIALAKADEAPVAEVAA